MGNVWRCNTNGIVVVVVVCTCVCLRVCVCGCVWVCVGGWMGIDNHHYVPRSAISPPNKIFCPHPALVCVYLVSSNHWLHFLTDNGLVTSQVEFGCRNEMWSDFLNNANEGNIISPPPQANLTTGLRTDCASCANSMRMETTSEKPHHCVCKFSP